MCRIIAIIASQLLQALAFTPVRTVRKQRRHATVAWKGHSVEVVLDRVDTLGTFVELELIADPEDIQGAQETIMALARELSLSQVERRSYLELVLEQEMLKEAIKKGFSILADCYVAEDSVTVMNLLLDASQPMRVRIKAAEMIGDIGELEAIEPLKNLKGGNDVFAEEIQKAVTKIHKRFYTRECPFCAEIIKKRASVCKHCGKEVAGG